MFLSTCFLPGDFTYVTPSRFLSKYIYFYFYLIKGCAAILNSVVLDLSKGGGVLN
jgi:hypothetical protein